MSTIVTENLKRSSETASRSLRGVAAAWVNFNGTGTVAIRDSENISGLTDNGTGDYTVSFSNSLNSANYSYVFGGALNRRLQLVDTGAGATSSSIRVQGQNNANTAFDIEVYNTSIFGDLA